MSDPAARLPLLAVVFDFDGVLVDSGEFHRYTWSLAHKLVFGRELPDYETTELLGAASREIARHIASLSGAPERGDELYHTRLEVFHDCRRTPEFAPGAREFTAYLTRAEIPYAVVSNAPSVYVQTTCRRLSLRPIFALGLEELAGKPKPDKYPYQRAAELLGFTEEQYARVLVVEDSPTGARAGIAAGMAVLGLSRRRAAVGLREAGVRWIVRDLAELLSVLHRGSSSGSSAGAAQFDESAQFDGFPGFR